MKKILQLTALSLFTFYQVKAQNVFGTGVGDNVGIGTTSPIRPLHIINNNNTESILVQSNSLGWGSGLKLSNKATGGKTYGLYSAAWGGLHLTDEVEDRLVINTNGNIILGGNTALAKLHIKDQNIFQQRLESTGNFSGFLLGSAATTKLLGIHYGTDGTSGLGTNNLRFGRYSGTGSNGGGGWEANTVLFDLDAPDGSFVVTENGNVGIGTYTPSTKLEVAGDMYSNGWASARGFDIREAGDNAVKSIQGGQIQHLIGTYVGWDPKGVYIAGYNKSINSYGITENVYIGNPTHNNNFLAVNLMNGGVGIGTTNTNDANYRLFVETGIRTRKVKVDISSWADYVFEPTYKLLTLQEIEQFIKQNKHLPGVPSAKEVEANGLDLGESQAILLKKIEELTLYIIEQQKLLEDSRQQNKAMDERLKKMEIVFQNN